MKQRAIIYTRVSTDEQNNGYSPLDQKTKLYQYCENNKIEVVGFFHDDESGKTFDRPEWINIMSFIQKNRDCVDLIIFLKWDRFSRNVAEAYIAIKALRKFNVEPLAIEQPLDFEVPESKIMLAIYLAAPEVDNDRRALNIFNGMRRARKEGRWVGCCLRGYKNTRDENNRPIMTPEGGSQEKLVRKAFRDFASGIYNIEELRRKLNKEGLKCNRSSFWKLLKNKGYIGKVFVMAYKDEPSQWVDGLHEPLISEKTFYDVQDILDGRRKKIPNTFARARAEYPLRGFLACPRCSKPLTASASTGKSGNKFLYYHCTKGCRERQKVDVVNNAFTDLLKGLQVDPFYLELYAEILKDKLKNSNSSVKKDIENNSKELLKQQTRQKNARNLMLDGEITSSEFKEMKIEIEENITQLTVEAINLKSSMGNYEGKIDACLDLILDLEKLYLEKDTVVKQRIISSIFKEKLIFENSGFRTPKLNEVVALICSKDKAFEGNEKGKNCNFNNSSLQVDPERFELSSK